MEHNSQENNASFIRNYALDPIQNNMQNRTNHSINLPIHSTRSLNTEGPDQGFQRRTVESARQLRDNLNNVIRGIRPLVDTARIVNARTMALSSFLNRPQENEESPLSATSMNVNEGNNSFVINLEDPSPSSAVFNQNNVLDVPINQENLINHNNRQDEADNDRTSLEAQRSLKPLQKYVPFVLILLVKGLYDHHEGILNFAALFVTFAYTNATTKNEATKRAKKSKSKLSVSLLYIFLCTFLISYIFEDEKLYMSLIFIKTFEQPFNVWDLLWYVCITDFMLKLITVGLKIFVILIPGSVLPYSKRVNNLLKLS